MEQKEEFVKLAEQATSNFSALCDRFGLSRRTGYKWLNRYKEHGLEGLKERSKRPDNSPDRTPAEIEKEIVKLREQNPEWGAKKLFSLLQQRYSGPVPARSTINTVLKRNGLITEAKSTSAQKWQRFEHEAPNNLWQMDFKGYFDLLDNKQCHPLTILDDHSRFNLCLSACDNERYETVKQLLTMVFRTYGLPNAILADNGPPWGTSGSFTSRGAPSISKLEKWLFQQNVRVLHGKPYHPQTQGKEERFHRTLKAELLQYERFKDHHHAQKRFDWWRNKYNCYRPHEAIGFQTPISRYKISSRSYTEHIRPPEYNSSDTIRKVYDCGCVRLKGSKIKVGKAFTGEHVAIKQLDTDKEYEVYYYNQLIRKISLP